MTQVKSWGRSREGCPESYEAVGGLRQLNPMGQMKVRATH